jgi:hypothetical protein
MNELKNGDNYFLFFSFTMMVMMKQEERKNSDL